ncbi:glycoside hydrolase family 88 protein [Chitinophaga nivalis]|uniref:Glycoside hydrolase family 88 protein n=1 Tax=Chitinophaga nivalis TaxID=2991709 RepID=A0ABT3ISH9_9BACT|nr:glycoside hydrolase family 88 protein [Chitinophaga nivalis]MCW3463420.1 glycoside hydrolase family 88 protein [Chitinophaga nivalis]MCW3486890.1 glycoside hydrolase family 88 protein [Chitinophaga nivalis]
MVKKIIAGSLLGLSFLGVGLPVYATAPDHGPQLATPTYTGADTYTAAVILSQMERTAAWQWKHIEEKGWTYAQTDWTNGAMYAGMMALSEVTANPYFIERLTQIGRDNSWNTGPLRFFADDYCIGQLYAQLYSLYKDPVMTDRFRKLADSIVAAPHTEGLEWKNSIHLREWAWCDALFMGPPALAYLSTATGDPRYLETATKLWWKTTDFLFDKTENLYYRDGRFIGQQEKNGAKVFWSRGNGWVMGGLARMMDNMPANTAEKARFQELFKKMAYRVAALQTKDGTWHASLLDPDSYPSKETSGTGFYVYAFMWGVNNGLLPEKDFMPVIQKGWDALTGCVQPDGKLGFVQIPAAEPGKATAEDTEVYGVGAFLLAGAEMVKYDLRKNAANAIKIHNGSGIHRASDMVEIPYKKLTAAFPGTTGKTFKITDAVSGKEIPYQLLYEGNKAPGNVLLQVNVAPGATLYAQVASGIPAALKPAAYGRFVPERKDDYAWENDRMAYRMYGAALEKFPKEMALGIDVWAKRTTDMVIDNWYKLDNYHHDNGQGLDYYSVGLTLGAGDNAPAGKDTIYFPKNFRTWKTLDNGPLRTTFALTYDTWQAGGIPVSVTKTISLDAGSQLNKMQLQYSFKGNTLPVVTGIVKRKEPGTVLLDEQQGVMGYWEPVHGADGTLGLGCVFTQGVPGMKTDAVHLLSPGTADSQHPYVYYSGAAWSKGGRITTAAAWFAYLETFAQKIKQPLTVTFNR